MPRETRAASTGSPGRSLWNSPITDEVIFFRAPIRRCCFNPGVKPKTVFWFGLLLAGPLIAAEVPPEIEDARVVEIGKLPPRGNHWSHPDAASARQHAYGEGPRVRSLNGEWKFHWAARPEERIADFHRPGFDISSWGTIPVPSTWEREGHGTPLYVNITYPFKVDPPRVMGAPDSSFTSFAERNPVGSYVREFEIPETWRGMRVILHFGGVRSAMFVWINGERIGYSQGSRLPAEFDVTEHLLPGSNRLSVEVYKFSDASYLEDQDFWRLSGIFRDVLLHAIPAEGLWDAHLEAALDLSRNQGRLVLHTEPMPGAEPEIHFSLHGPSDETMDSTGSELVVDEPRLWSPEAPFLYHAEVTVRSQGRLLQLFRLPVGFRKLEVVGHELHFNGRPFKIRGVNRHEFDPQTGYVMSEALMREDLELMKRANINFVRNAHYPCDPRWHDLCDRIGMLVLDEANVESHGLSYHKRVLPGDQADWTAACVERMTRMVVRDRQHPCVAMWSLGNEAGYGDAFLAMREAARNADPQERLIQYADMNLAADIDSQTYPPISWLRQHVQGKAKRKGEQGQTSHEAQHGPYPSDRPFLMNEYAHAMGNSVGNLQDYWDLIWAEPMISGGFIWDWVDQALYRDRTDPERGFLYGGDFGDVPTDTNFCVNGLIAANRRPHPHYEEVRKVYQPVAFHGGELDEGRLMIENRALPDGLKGLTLEYLLLADGEAVASGPLPLPDIGMGEKQAIEIGEITRRKGNADAEWLVTFRLALDEATSWAPNGHIVAWEQFILRESESPTPSAVGPSSFERSADDILLSAGAVTARVSAKTGLLDSYRIDGREMLAQSMRWNFWRALTDNDLGWKVDRKLAIWKDAGRETETISITPGTDSDQQAYVESESRIPGTGVMLKVRHTMIGDGTMRVQCIFRREKTDRKKLPPLPRLGLQFAMPASFEHIDWYGRGPHENYQDRKTSAAIGRYQSTVAGWVTPYVRPQENANRCDIRWIQFTDRAGIGLDIRGASPLSVSAWPYSMEDLAAATHDFELPSRDFITVNLDHLQMGVGGDNSWGLPVNDDYRIPSDGDYHWEFSIRPLRP